MRINKLVGRSVAATAIASLAITLGAVQASADTGQAPAMSSNMSSTEFAVSSMSEADTAFVVNSGLIPVTNDRGTLIGYRFSAEDAAMIAALGEEMSGIQGYQAGDRLFQPQNGVSTNGYAACAAAVSLFIGTTLIPIGRASYVAGRMLSYISQYGFRKVVAILSRTYRGQDSQKLFIEFAKELSGVAALEAACANL